MALAGCVGAAACASVASGSLLPSAAPASGPPVAQVFLALAAGPGPLALALAFFSPFAAACAAALDARLRPYRLYAYSNAGSLLGLVAAAFVADLLLPTSVQARVLPWTAGLAFACGAAGAWLLRARVPMQRRAWRARRRWRVVALSGVVTALLVTFTRSATSDLPPVPLFWVVPLALYLLAFVFAFSDVARAERWLPVFSRAASVALPALCLLALVTLSSVALLALFCVCFAVAVLFCMVRLAADSPAAACSASYYLHLAAGGAAGGFLGAVAAPALLPALWELPIAACACALFIVRFGVLGLRPSLFVFGLILLGLILLRLAPAALLPSPVSLAVVSLLFAFLLALRRFPLLFSAALCLATVSLTLPSSGTVVLARERSFFGAYVVHESVGPPAVRSFFHGSTRHGSQLLRPSPGVDPVLTAYYTADSPLALALSRAPAAPAAFVGLGVGSLLCAVAPATPVDVYELDPLVGRLAARYFSALARCPPRSVRYGDARALLDGAPPVYATLVLDAFSSDAVPVHLLTVQALSVYFEVLRPDGVLVLHLSHRLFDLRPPVLGAAQRLGYAAVFASDRPSPARVRREAASSSLVAVLARTPEVLAARGFSADPWARPSFAPSAPWTDDHAPVLAHLH